MRHRKPVADVDVLVVGAGLAGLTAALAALETRARVAILDAALPPWVGGSSALTSGAFRTTWADLDDLRRLVPVPDAVAAPIDLDPYPAEAFLADLLRMSGNTMDPVLAATIAGESRTTMAWLRDAGSIEWELLLGRQSFPQGARSRFWGNLAIGVRGGGRALVDRLRSRVLEEGGQIEDGTRVAGLLRDRNRVTGAAVESGSDRRTVRARAVVLAAGGFQAASEHVARHLGPEWREAAVRGTPRADGTLLFEALAHGAAPAGEWTGCHAVAWDAAVLGPDADRAPVSSRQAYPWGLVVNRKGRRFVDEGADFRNYTYARYGREILAQPGSAAWQLFDARTRSFLTPDYATAAAHEASSIEELAVRAGIDRTGLAATVAAFNAGVGPEPFDPAVLDGRGAAGPGVDPPRSNWANPLVHPPFLAVPVRCGLTFTYGGLRVDGDGRVVDDAGRAIPGLSAAGETAGLFHGNIPGGTALTAAAVIGRRAGRAAADGAGAR